MIRKQIPKNTSQQNLDTGKLRNDLNPLVLSSVTENLALDKPVTVGKRYNNKHFDPGLAVDGDVSTDLLSCSLTASGEKEAWLTVDLGEVKNIASISFLHGGCK